MGDHVGGGQLPRRLLIANRGDIAVRIARTCHELGITAIAVYSTADRNALHVRLADEAYPVGAAEASDSYLNVAHLLAAAHEAGADAVHPGYGFLSENADFARAVQAAGLLWIGPSPEAMEAMGNKARAKALVAQAGVAVVPGYQGDDQSFERMQAEAERIGLPVLIKAAAGGGGRGMREVRSLADLEPALTSARREAEQAFGDDRLLLERLIERPRHIEVQVFGDRQGRVIHLGERECSIQRRYQKVVEESPSPFVDEAMRAAMGAAAVAVTRAVGYSGAGTVEFVVDSAGRFYFLEMNTRIQVEHPVTEEVTGLDLVAWQLRIAAGQPLPLRQNEVRLSGHAIECRLYAESPGEGYVPSAGRLTRWRLPHLSGLRVEAGYAEGDEVSVHYDAMLAKVIARGRSRVEARAVMQAALAQTEVEGVATNLALLRAIVAQPAFAAGDLQTGFIEEQGLLAQVSATESAASAAVAALALAWSGGALGTRVGGSPGGQRGGTGRGGTGSLAWSSTLVDEGEGEGSQGRGDRSRWIAASTDLGESVADPFVTLGPWRQGGALRYTLAELDATAVTSPAASRAGEWPTTTVLLRRRWPQAHGELWEAAHGELWEAEVEHADTHLRFLLTPPVPSEAVDGAQTDGPATAVTGENGLTRLRLLLWPGGTPVTVLLVSTAAAPVAHVELPQDGRPQNGPQDGRQGGSRGRGVRLLSWAAATPLPWALLRPPSTRTAGGVASDDHEAEGNRQVEVRAPLPGKVGRQLVAVGGTVALGDPILLLEAMKMEHTVSAPASGRVDEYLVQPGEVVARNQVLLHIEMA